MPYEASDAVRSLDRGRDDLAPQFIRNMSCYGAPAVPVVSASDARIEVTFSDRNRWPMPLAKPLGIAVYPVRGYGALAPRNRAGDTRFSQRDRWHSRSS